MNIKDVKQRQKQLPERILQIGEGNFLRAFVDWIIYKMNKEKDFNSGVTVIQPIEKGLVDLINKQEGLYTLYLNGIKEGKPISEHTIIDCINRGINPYQDFADYMNTAENPDIRFIISNTTEAGIVYDKNDKITDQPPKSFPAKLTAWLYKRYESKNKGVVIIPCELIDKNGSKLKEAVEKTAKNWELDQDFMFWLENENVFCNSLVDRIVPGYPKEKINALYQQLGYEDQLIVEAEQFHLWVIEAPKWVKEEFPADQAGLNVLFVENMTPYRTRKVRILNGAHTTMVPVAYLYGLETVKEAVEDDVIGQYIKDAIFKEIIPTLDLPENELNTFAKEVIDRFRNPYIKHYLISIALNSNSKFVTRVLPSLIEYKKKHQRLPQKLVFSLAALIAFYKGKVGTKEIPLKDDAHILKIYEKAWKNCGSTKENYEKMVESIFSEESIWKQNLNDIEGLSNIVAHNLYLIDTEGIEKALNKILL